MELTDDDRAEIARGWRTSGKTQAEYAAHYGITDRTLRDWVARWAPEYRGTEAVRAACEQTIERLQALIDSLRIETRDGAVDQVQAPPAAAAGSGDTARRGSAGRNDAREHGHRRLDRAGT